MIVSGMMLVQLFTFLSALILYLLQVSALANQLQTLFLKRDLTLALIFSLVRLLGIYFGVTVEQSRSVS